MPGLITKEEEKEEEAHERRSEWILDCR